MDQSFCRLKQLPSADLWPAAFSRPYFWSARKMPFPLAKAHDAEVAIGFMSFEEGCEFCPFPSKKQKQFLFAIRYDPL